MDRRGNKNREIGEKTLKMKTLVDDLAPFFAGDKLQAAEFFGDLMLNGLDSLDELCQLYNVGMDSQGQLTKILSGVLEIK